MYRKLVISPLWSLALLTVFNCQSVEELKEEETVTPFAGINVNPKPVNQNHFSFKPDPNPTCANAIPVTVRVKIPPLINQCKWNSVTTPDPANDNGPPCADTEAIITARAEQKIKIPALVGKEVCSLSIKSTLDSFQFDDHVLMALNGKLIAMSDETLLSRFDKSGEIPLYGWDKLKGGSNRNRTNKGWCVGLPVGSPECLFPATEQVGKIDIKVADAKPYLNEQGEIEFNLITTGDNDLLLDCKHNGFEFDFTFSILPPKNPPVYQGWEYQNQSPHDYLFVVDNSYSMQDIINKVKAGFATLDRNEFPLNTKVGVISTMAAKNARADRINLLVHPDTHDYPFINFEPGFLQPVDAAMIAQFKNKVKNTTAAKYADQYPLMACSTGWFDPMAKNSNNSARCIDAALQFPLHPVQIEPGILAYRHYIQRNEQESFRRNAAAHVVFVTDTQDPGGQTTNAQLLNTGIRQYANLQTLTNRNDTISSLRFHGLIPRTRSGGELCGEGKRNWLLGNIYDNLILQSGGEAEDVCRAQKYEPFMKRMLQSDGHVFILKSAAEKIYEVIVNGKPTSRYEVLSPTRVKVYGLNSRSSVVEIAYKAVS